MCVGGWGGCVCACVHACVCGISFDLAITKQNSLFVRCRSLSHKPSTLRCSIWKLNLMTGVNTTKQQTGEFKNTI